MAEKINATTYSSTNASIPKGSATKTSYCSSSVLAKIGGGKDQGRAPGYKLEDIKK